MENNILDNTDEINKLEKAKLDKYNELHYNGKNPFIITKYDITNHSKEIIDNFDKFNNNDVSIAGRLMFKRVMGKALFLFYYGFRWEYSIVCVKR